MKTKLLLTTILSFSFYLLSSQSPQGFNYQAIARDGSGNQIPSLQIQVKLAVTADSAGTNIIWEELFNPVTTNAYGLFTVVLGQGVRQATSSAATFSNVNWNSWPLFVKTQIFYQGAWKIMGSSRLWSVPYALNANKVTSSQPYLNVTGNTSVMDSALFVVRNNIGQIIFAVYNEGVRIFVDNGVKGTNKGGFAIGSFGTGKAPSQEFFRVTSDSTRVYVNPNAKGTKGGFAIGGFGAKGSDTYLNLTPNNYFIGQGSGLNNTTGLYNSFTGFQSGYTNSTGGSNVFLGYQSGYKSNADYNAYVGYQAGYSTTTGGYNAFIGYKAGYANTTGYYNVIVGFSAGISNTTGWGNVFIGPYAGYYNTAGNTNTFVGNSAGFNNTGGINTFIGYSAGLANTSGQQNTFLGYYAGSSATTGTGNIAVGSQTGSTFITNSNNTFVGDVSGRFTAGDNNTFLGNGSGYNCQGSGNVLLGLSAGQQLAGSNKLVIENSSNITSPLIGGDFSANRIGIGRMPTTYTLEVAGTIWANGSTITAGASTWSDVRYKQDIIPLSNALDNVLKMQGVRYNWRRSSFPDLNFPEGEQIGVIAQDVEKIVPEVVITGADGYKSVSYEKLVPVLIEAIKEQQKQIDELKSLVNQLTTAKSK